MRAAFARTGRPLQTPDPLTAFLTFAGPVDGLHVLVLGGGAIDAMCRLNQQGALSVTAVRGGRCSASEPADLVVVPQTDSAELAEAAATHARLSTRPAASLLLRFQRDAADAAALPSHATHQLLRFGFSVARLDLPDQVVIRAERRHS